MSEIDKKLREAAANEDLAANAFTSVAFVAAIVGFAWTLYLGFHLADWFGLFAALSCDVVVVVVAIGALWAKARRDLKVVRVEARLE